MRGIVSDNGNDALDVFGLRLRFLGCARLSDAVSALLRGDGVDSTDGALELQVQKVDPEHWLTTVTLVDAPYKCEIALTPRTEDDGLGPLEPQPVESVPGQWCHVVSQTATRWQLLNVVIDSVAPVRT